MSETKNISSLSSSLSDEKMKTKSLFPRHVEAIFEKGLINGFRGDKLDLWSKGINDYTIPELCEWLAKLEGKVKMLALSANQITSQGGSMLFDMLREMKSSIKEISLSNCKKIGDECMKSLGEYIKANMSIRELWLGYNAITDEGIETLAPYLDGNTTIKRLHIDGNMAITDKSSPILIKMIESSHLEHVWFSNTRILQKKIINVSMGCNQIKRHSEFLDLPMRAINDDDLINICENMKKFGVDKLKDINFEENQITSKGASVLFDVLRGCSSIVSRIVLESNQLDDECVEHVGKYIQDNEYLEMLNMNGNIVTDKGIEILSEYMIGNVILKGLHFGWCKRITDTSVPYLLEIAKKSSIFIIDLQESGVSEERQQEIREALKVPVDQREIPIKSSTKSATKISISASAQI